MRAKVIKTGEVVDVYHEPQHGQITNIYKESVFVNGRMWTEDELDFSIKVNEAPEKLYLFPNGQILYCKYKGDNVEYTRTDSFIEKVYNWLKNYAFVDDNKNVNLPVLLHDFLKDSRTF